MTIGNNAKTKVANILFYNRDSNHEATVVFVRDAPFWPPIHAREGLELDAKEGLSVAEFYKSLGFTPVQVQAVLPEHIKNDRPPISEWNWEEPINYLAFPFDEEGLQTLADFLKMRVQAFWRWKKETLARPLHEGQVFEPAV